MLSVLHIRTMQARSTLCHFNFAAVVMLIINEKANLKLEPATPLDLFLDQCLPWSALVALCCTISFPFVDINSTVYSLAWSMQNTRFSHKHIKIQNTIKSKLNIRIKD